MSDFDKDRRHKLGPIPSDIDALLNEKQKASIEQLKGIGWKLWFVRRPKFQPVIPVLSDNKNELIAMVDEDGTVLEEHILEVRK